MEDTVIAVVFGGALIAIALGGAATFWFLLR